MCCYIGVPYLHETSRSSTSRKRRAPWARSSICYNVYRYTHGDPEHQPAWWIGQLHKSLFDEDELTVLLRDAGFQSFVMFCYGYPGDDHELPVTMGFYASGVAVPIEQQREECVRFLGRFADQRIRLNTLVWLPAAEAPPLASGPAMRAT